MDKSLLESKISKFTLYPQCFGNTNGTVNPNVSTSPVASYLEADVVTIKIGEELMEMWMKFTSEFIVKPNSSSMANSSSTSILRQRPIYRHTTILRHLTILREWRIHRQPTARRQFSICRQLTCFPKRS